MLFMDIVTWKSEKRDEVAKRAIEWKCPEGMKEHGYWIDLTGNRAFYLHEVDDPKVILASNENWTDIAEIDSVPVMEFEEILKLLPKN